MRPSAGYLYSALAIVFAVAFGLGVGPYWVDDAIVLALLALGVLSFCLRETEGMKSLVSLWSPASAGNQPRDGNQARFTGIHYAEYVPRSKIARFVTLSRIAHRSPSAWDSHDPFERELLSHSGWQELSADELNAIVQARLK